MAQPLDDILLVGIDGGATEVKAHQVDWSGPTGPDRAGAADGQLGNLSLGQFRLGVAAASRKYDRLPDFTPVQVSDQFAQRDAGRIDLTDSERRQGCQWVDAAVASVAEVCAQAGRRRTLIGMGMPGLKTTDGRGIEVINNGPRIPDFLQQFEARLAAGGIELAVPVAALGSDADYCGLGEMHAESGLLRDVKNAYYAGAGTGVADAMVLDGQLVPFDAAKPWLQKAWQFPSAIGPTFEKLVSASSLNALYHGLAPNRADAFPEADAAAGQPVAVATMRLAATVLAELLLERLWTIARGRMPLTHRGEAYLALKEKHPYSGTILERLILGQRLGAVYADDRYQAVFAEPLRACLAAMIGQTDDRELIAHALDHGNLKSGFLLGSTLRAAPAIGAAVAAVAAWGGD
jgi:hypothetical protein